MRYLFCIFSVLIALNVAAQTTVIRGEGKGLARQKLTFFINNNPITNKPDKIGTCTSNSNGQFRAKIFNDRTQRVWFDYGNIRCYFFAEPNGKYKLQLPKYTERNELEKQSPFFKPKMVQLQVTSEDTLNLNNLILDYQQELDQVLNKALHPLVEQHSKKHFDQIKQFINSKVKDGYPDFFIHYLHFQLAYFDLLRDPRNTKYIMQSYFQTNHLYLNIPTANMLFSTITGNFLQTIPYSLRNNLNNAIHNTDLKMVKSIATTYGGMSKEYTELMLIRNFYDSFYRKDFSPAKMEILLNKLTRSRTEDIAQLARTALHKINYMRQGSAAPQFRLLNQRSQYVDLQSFYGKFTYLVFVRSDDFASQQYLKFLKDYHQRFHEDLNIVTIALQDNFQGAIDYFKENGYDWQLLKGNKMTKIKEKYEIVTLPSYFLIDRDGNLRLSPAPSPAESFDKRFSQILKADRIEQLRNRHETK